VYNFKANAAVVNELNHTLNINDNVIRHMIINIDDK
jgi:small subunit ribosomal protein S6